MTSPPRLQQGQETHRETNQYSIECENGPPSLMPGWGGGLRGVGGQEERKENRKLRHKGVQRGAGGSYVTKNERPRKQKGVNMSETARRG